MEDDDGSSWQTGIRLSELDGLEIILLHSLAWRLQVLPEESVGCTAGRAAGWAGLKDPVGER